MPHLGLNEDLGAFEGQVRNLKNPNRGESKVKQFFVVGRNSLRLDRHHHDAVARHFRREVSGERAEVLVGPEVSHFCRQVWWVSDISP